MKLSILIPTTPDRNKFMLSLFIQFEQRLGKELYHNPISDQDFDLEIEKREYIRTFVWPKQSAEVIVFEDHGQNSIGYKRNALLQMASADYVAFIDSDDRIGDNYFKHAFEGIDKRVDVCGLTGIITEDGKNPKKFVHSIKYDSWFEKDNVYYRNNNHLNVIKREIAIQMKFPEINNGEDHDYSKQLLKSGLIKTEYWDENEILYYYDYRTRK